MSAPPQAPTDAPPSAPAPPPAAATQPKPPPTTQSPTNFQPTLLNQPELKLQFGRLNSTKRRIETNIDPGAFSRVFIAEYRALVHTLGGLIAPVITEDEYVRMSRTLVLKRLQDVYEYQTGLKSPDALRMARALVVPMPTAELLYSFGPYFCDVNGRQYNLSYPPAPPQAPPNWYTLDPTILSNYRLLMDQVKNRYMTTSFPKMSDVTGQPTMFTVGLEVNGLKTIRASINVPTPADAFLRFVHEEYYTNVVPVFNNCDLVMTETLFVEDVISAYVRSYVTNVHG